MRRVLVESPYAGKVERNTEYARECMLDSLTRDEAPMLGHLLYTQVYEDSDAEQRKAGIAAHMAWLEAVDAVIVYTDYGISEGMRHAIRGAEFHGVPVERRRLYRDTPAA